VAAAGIAIAAVDPLEGVAPVAAVTANETVLARESVPMASPIACAGVTTVTADAIPTTGATTVTADAIPTTPVTAAFATLATAEFIA